MEDNQILIHVGMAKAASTFLQKEVFSERKFGFLYDDNKRLKFYQHILPQHTPYYDLDSCRTLLEKELLAEASNQKLMPVWSNELLSGWPSYGSYNRELLANRLHELFPKAKILLIIREQKTAIESVYNQYIQEGGTMSLKAYLSQNWVAPYFHGFNLDQYDYFKMLNLYKGLFGEENVLCLPYELLNEQASSFVDHLNTFLEVSIDFKSLDISKKVNRSPSHSYLWFKRQLGKVITNRRSVSNQNAIFYTWYVRYFWPAMRLPGFIDKKIANYKKASIHDFVGDYFKNSNRLTQETMDIDLQSLGYSL